MERLTVARPSAVLRPRRAAAAAIAIVLAIASVVPAPPARAEDTQTVVVEHLRPKKEKLPTLRFLKENRDFIRARYDLLRQKPGEHTGDAGEIDPRFLAYQAMLREIMTSRDSVVVAADSLDRLQLLASITELGRLEGQLDLMDRVLAEQRTRLGVLQEDFIGRQLTALMVVVSGWSAQAPVTGVRITLEDGDTLTVPLTPEHRAALQKGGVVQIFHGFVEPREQVVEVAITGDRWPAGDTGYVTLDPARDRLTLLRLDLSSVRPDLGAAGIEANTWLHDARPHPGDG
jgi:hypothetical protein